VIGLLHRIGFGPQVDLVLLCLAAAGEAGQQGDEHLRVGASPARHRVPSGTGLVTDRGRAFGHVVVAGRNVVKRLVVGVDVVVGLFNVTGAPEVISTSASAFGVKAGPYYLLNDLWSHRPAKTTGTISAAVPSHGVALFRLSPGA
jgi:alpha galactosidase C-like protein